MRHPLLVPPSFASGLARSASESIAPHLWQNLAGAWVPELGPTGSTLVDISQGRHNGALTNMAPASDWVMEPVRRGGGYALNYDGTDDYIDLSTVVGNPLTQSFTVVSWIWASSTHTMRIMQRRGTGSRGTEPGWVLGWLANSNFDWGLSGVEDTAGNYVYITQGQDFTWADSTWHQIVMRWDTNAQALTIWKDGVDQGLTTAVSGTVGSVSSTRNATIGCSWQTGTSQFFAGNIGNVLYYERALLSAEIQELYDFPLAPFAKIPRRIAIIVAADPPTEFAGTLAQGALQPMMIPTTMIAY